MSKSEKNLKTIERRPFISNSNQRQPLLNALKAWKTVPAGSIKKWEPSKEPTKINYV